MIFPVSLKGARKPVISDGYHWRGDKLHAAVDIMYRRQDGEFGIMPWASQNYIMFPSTAAVAPMDGEVVRAEMISTGGHVHIVNGTTGFKFMHLTNLKVKLGQKVKAGDVIGSIGDNPKDSGDPAHLHFEIEKNGDKVDPEPYLKDATYVSRSVGLGLLEFVLISAVLWYVTKG